MSQDKKSAAEAILDWFERNPAAKARSGPLAKALKIDPTRVAEALARLALPGGQLLRVKVEVGAKDRLPGAAKEQWEYWLALGGKAPEPVKTYKVPPAFRREASTPAQALKKSPIVGKTESPAPQAIPGMGGESGEMVDKVVKNDADCSGETLAEWEQIAAENGWNGPQDLVKHLAELDDQIVEVTRRSVTDLEIINNQTAKISQISADGIRQLDKIRDLEARLVEAEKTANHNPVGYIISRPKKPLRRVSQLLSAKNIAIGAVRAGSQAEVFALHPVGKAIPCAEWKPRA